jgi:hypothetical protein
MMKRDVMSSRDMYTWNVTYEDGTRIDEYDADRPDGRGWAEVDQARVRRVEIEAYNDLITSHVVHIPQNATPVFFRRRFIELGPDGESRRTVHCIGFNFCYLFIFEDGSTLLSTDLQAV